MISGQGETSSLYKNLPNLPGMLIRSIATLPRKGLVDENANFHFEYQAQPIDTHHLANYREQLGGFKAKLPLTYFYLLAQRAQLAAMLHPSFPWPILGMVHVANQMSFEHTPKIDAPLNIQVAIELPARAATRKRVRPVFVVTFKQDSQVILTCRSTYQVVVGGGTTSSVERRANQVTELDLAGWDIISHWSLPSQLGRQYARLSGDYNPIHIHRWLSKWFGFPRPIIHGMYSVGRFQASIEQALQQEVIDLEASFRLPIVLPTALSCALHKEKQAFMLIDPKGTKIFMQGQYNLTKAS